MGNNIRRRKTYPPKTREFLRRGGFEYQSGKGPFLAKKVMNIQRHVEDDGRDQSWKMTLFLAGWH